MEYFSMTPHFSIRSYVLASTVSEPDDHCHTEGSCIPDTSGKASGIETFGETLRPFHSQIKKCGTFILLSQLNKCIVFEDVNRGESNGKLPLRTCPECSVPEPYRSPDWALVLAKTGLRAE
jgi:hypothetical protein